MGCWKFAGAGVQIFQRQLRVGVDKWLITTARRRKNRVLHHWQILNKKSLAADLLLLSRNIAGSLLLPWIAASPCGFLAMTASFRTKRVMLQGSAATLIVSVIAIFASGV